MKLRLGLIMVVSSLLYLFSLFLPLIKVEISYQTRRQFPVSTITNTEPLSRNFGLIIPKLDINARVIKNVDPSDPQKYQSALSQGVAHALGSSLPTEKGNIFIFAHSSVSFMDALKYNSIFYLLPKLEIGDDILLHYQDKQYRFVVAEKQVVSPERLDFIYSKEINQLLLMTCYPPGTNLKRFIVVARPDLQ